MRVYTSCPGCGELILELGRLFPRPTHFGCKDTTLASRLTASFLAAATAGRETEADELAAQLDGLDAGPPRLADAAAVYARWGWPVFPLMPGDKIPFPKSHGFKDATTDPATVAAWWRTHPEANIGVPTGIQFDVIDVDFRHGALPAWLKAKQSDRMPVVHGQVSTAHGGLHAYVMPEGGGNHAWQALGIDYRGKGGYVVVPPSRLADGGRYAWGTHPSPLLKTGGAP